MSRLPREILESPRARVAVAAAEGAGAALMRIRGESQSEKELGDQLKTAADQAAEGWVLGYVLGHFPGEPVLSEESFEAKGVPWQPEDAFWTVDALDGTRSFVDGFDGFCVQLAWIEHGVPRVGVVHEPVLGRTYVAVAGAGAFRLEREADPVRLVVAARDAWPEAPVFVDSTPPAGAVGELRSLVRGGFLELGSIGLKLCRVADASADVFAKRLRFKLWDVAPAAVVLAEAGAEVGLWDASRIPFDTAQVHFQDILAAPRGLFERASEALTTGR